MEKREENYDRLEEFVKLKRQVNRETSLTGTQLSALGGAAVLITVFWGYVFPGFITSAIPGVGAVVSTLTILLLVERMRSENNDIFLRRLIQNRKAQSSNQNTMAE